MIFTVSSSILFNESQKDFRRTREESPTGCSRSRHHHQTRPHRRPRQRHIKCPPRACFRQPIGAEPDHDHMRALLAFEAPDGFDVQVAIREDLLALGAVAAGEPTQCVATDATSESV